MNTPPDASAKIKSGTLSPQKLFVFRLILFLLPFLVFIFIEGSFRLLTEKTEDPFINVTPFQVFTIEKKNGVEIARITHRYGYAARNTTFQVSKPANTIRFFFLGGSACAGWPHVEQETFAKYLEKSLQSIMPDKRVEIINASAHGFASYRIRHIFDELIEMDPDGILIYSGNNEFLEAREYSTTWAIIDRLANSLQSIRWLRSRLMQPKTNLAGDELKGVAQFFWKKIKQQALEVRKDPVQFQKVQAHYRNSIEYMVDNSIKRNVPVLLCTVPVNLRDWLPIVSHNRLPEDELKKWQSIYNNARKNYLNGEYAVGIENMNKALRMESEHAESHFWLGVMLQVSNRPEEAYESYSKARDLDYNPFRAISAFNDAVREIAAQRDLAFLVDLENTYQKAAQGGIPGFDLFLDYVHPNTKGNILIANEVFHTIASNSALAEHLRIGDAARDNPSATEHMTSYDDSTDLNIQGRLFYLYSQNHQHAAAIEKAKHLFRLAVGREIEPGEAMPVSFSTNVQEGYEVFTEYENTVKETLLGHTVSTEQIKNAQRKLQQYYDKYHSYGKF